MSALYGLELWEPAGGRILKAGEDWTFSFCTIKMRPLLCDTPLNYSQMTSFSSIEKIDLLARSVPVRQVAMDIFSSIYYEGTTLDRAFVHQAGFLSLNALDRALVRMIVTTTLRYLGQIDDVIQTMMNTDTTPEPQTLLTLLRLSVAQILFMNMPDYAAVNIAVNLAEAVDLKRQKGLVNAVLRRCAREGRDYIGAQDPARANIPSWMFRDWVRAYGVSVARQIGSAQLTEAPLDLTLKISNDAAAWAEKLGATILPGGTLRIHAPSGGIDALPGYMDGAWWVQDFSASLPVKVMGDITGKTVFDLCAAPGGKTAQLIAGGAVVTAIEKSSKRLDLLRQNLERLGMLDQCRIIPADAETWVPPDLADIVLIDAPCTATGTLRRNPDIMIHRDQSDALRLSKIQGHLLDHATTMIKADGQIVYAVCSLQRVEGEAQIDKFLKRFPDFQVKPIDPVIREALGPVIAPEGWIRALPCSFAEQGGMDGFFVVVLSHK